MSRKPPAPKKLFEGFLPKHAKELRAIFNGFFKPLFKHVTVSQYAIETKSELRTKLDIILGKKHREVDLYEATTRFELPGYKVERGGARVVDNAIVKSERLVPEGATMLVRFDDRSQEYIDVQYWGTRWDKAGDDRVFRLAPAEWAFIRPNLKEIKE